MLTVSGSGKQPDLVLTQNIMKKKHLTIMVLVLPGAVAQLKSKSLQKRKPIAKPTVTANDKREEFGF